MTDEKNQTTEKIAVNYDLVAPRMYNVILMNDDVTTMEFVVSIICEVFNHTPDDAMLITQKIHEEGSAIVAVLPYELAEQKAVEVTLLARNNNFPLNVKIEESTF